MQDSCKTIRHLSSLLLILVALFGSNVFAETEAQNCVTCNLNQNTFPVVTSLNKGLVHLVSSSREVMGECTKDDVRELISEGYIAKDIRLLCKTTPKQRELNYNENVINGCTRYEVRSLKAEGYSGEQIRELCEIKSKQDGDYGINFRATTCHSYGDSHICPLTSPRQYDAPCSCIMPYGRISGTAR